MTQTIPFKLLTKNGMGFHLVMKMKVNGKVANMIIDTGASHTVFDKTKMKKFITQRRFTKLSKTTTGVGGNKMDSHHTIIKKVTIGKISMMNYPGVMLDLSHVNATYKMMGLPEIDGVLGADVFMLFNAVIDYAKKTMTLNDKTVMKQGQVISKAEFNKELATKKKAKAKKKSTPKKKSTSKK